MFTDLKLYNSYKKILDNVRSEKNTAIFGVQSGERAFIANGLEKFVLYVATDYIEAKKAERALNAIGKEYKYLPFKDDVLLYKKNANHHQCALKNAVLYGINNGLNGVIVSVEGLAQIYPNKELFMQSVIRIKDGDTIDLKILCEKLIKAGYERAPLVSVAGEFSLRGDILDVFSPIDDDPVRIEFFDNLVENVKYFDVETHTSIGVAKKVDIVPIKEYFEQTENAALKNAKNAAKKLNLKPDAAIRAATILSELEIDSDNDWLLPYTDYSTLMDYLPQNAVIVWQEPKQLIDRTERYYNEHYTRTEYLIERGELLSGGVNALINKEDLFKTKVVSVAFMALTASSFFKAQDIVNLQNSALQSYKSNLDILSSDIKRWLADGYKVGIFVGANEKAERLRLELYNRDCPLKVTADTNDSLINGCIISSDFADGFISHSNKLVLVGESQLYAAVIPTQKKLRKSQKQAFLTVEAGDYVVHDIHGIGLCAGTTVIKGEFGEKDYIVVKYRNNDTLYVPVESSNLLSKFSGKESEPKLSALGGGEFERIKARVKSKLKELAIDLLKLYSERMHKRGYTYRCDQGLMDSFAQAFLYRETDDQLRCIEEVEKDLNSDKIMDRLLVGDVGFGKTEVAMRAVFKVTANGYQALVLAPTTILSQQHYETFKERFDPFGIKVVCLNRFRSKQEQTEIIKKIANGEAEVIIGTHRLLNKAVIYKNPGLLVLDEEQRFGVEHKEILKTIKTNLDVLSMSATPIPRTLHMALTGMRDISTISTPPKERLPVESFVVEDSSALIRDVILREISRNGQVFIVYNRVDSIDAFTFRICELVPEARIVIAHGQMQESKLEQTVYEFTKHQADVLISTTIIENGIDIPNANTLIVYDADKLGLSQLYQLRGRVGRSNKLAFAYFIYREQKVLSDEAYKRLTSIMENTELGSGFKIAMKDLEIRGAGNVLGREQHGHMEKVGYDTYVKLLSEVVAEIKGDPIKKKVNTIMDVDIDTHVPVEYIGDSNGRMEFYQRLANITNKADKIKLLSELKDIYGETPKPVLNLLDVAHVKAIANQLGICEVIIKQNNTRIIFASPEDIKTDGIRYALKLFDKLARLSTVGDKLAVAFNLKSKSTRYCLTAIRAFCESAINEEYDKE
ncbi:MAG: transcription-repair coupling factor [Clostridia bacterium]